MLFFHLGELKQALEFRLKALVFEKRFYANVNVNDNKVNINEELKLAISLEHVTDLCLEMNEFKKATKFFLKSRRYFLN